MARIVLERIMDLAWMYGRMDAWTRGIDVGRACFQTELKSDDIETLEISCDI